MSRDSSLVLERERQTDRQKEGERVRQTDRQTDRERKREFVYGTRKNRYEEKRVEV